MKKYLFLVLSAIFLFSAASSAQDQATSKKGKAPSVENRVAKMATDLSLTEAEKASVQTLLVKQNAEMKKFRTEVDKGSADFKPKLKELRKTQKTELKTTLGEEKFAKLQALRAEEK